MPHKNDNKRIHLLNDAEVETLYARPLFNDGERDGYFFLEEAEQRLLEDHRHLKSKLYFILQLGYFRATQQFFHFSLEDVEDDVLYLLKKYFSVPRREPKGSLSIEAYRRQRQEILGLFQYQLWSNQCKPMVMAHLLALVKLYPKGNDTLHELFVYLENEKIVFPSYRTLQDIFTEVFSIERARLATAITHISPTLQQQLDDIIGNAEALVGLNDLRQDQRDFRYSAIQKKRNKKSNANKSPIPCE